MTASRHHAFDFEAPDAPRFLHNLALQIGKPIASGERERRLVGRRWYEHAADNLTPMADARR